MRETVEGTALGSTTDACQPPPDRGSSMSDRLPRDARRASPRRAVAGAATTPRPVRGRGRSGLENRLDLDGTNDRYRVTRRGTGFLCRSLHVDALPTLYSFAVGPWGRPRAIAPRPAARALEGRGRRNHGNPASGAFSDACADRCVPCRPRGFVPFTEPATVPDEARDADGARASCVLATSGW
jgi:hypothetical protein